MALIKCPECGKEISDKSEICVHCGYPLKNVMEEVEENDSQIEETKFFTICNVCGNINFTYKERIDNTTKLEGYPTCMMCGGRIKILAGKNQWMKKSKLDRENIVLEEIQRVKQGNDYDEEMAELFRNKIRPELDFQGYCPKCASDYPKSEALSKGCTTCEFCGSEIEYSDMLTSDFGVLWEQEKEKLGIDIPSNREPIERLIIKTFLLDNDKFDEVLFNKKWHPERYQSQLQSHEKHIPSQLQSHEKHIPKCPVCGTPNIKRIPGISKVGSVALWGIFSRKVRKQWHCDNCGSEW